MDKETVRALIPIMKEYGDVAKEVLDAFKEYVPLLKDLVSTLYDVSLDATDNTVKGYISRGYTREEAILFVLSTQVSLRDAFDKYKQTTKNT